MSDLVRASISIETELMERFDRFVETSGHSNRSEAIRDLIRARLLEEAVGDGEPELIGTVTVLYDHAQRRVTRQIEEHGHAHHDVVLSSMHIHVSPEVCLEIVALRGPADEVKHVANHLIGMPGVLHGRAVYSRADVEEALR